MTVFLLGIEKKTTAQNGITREPRTPNLDLMTDLIAVSISLRNVILIDQAEIFWSRTTKVISHVDPLHPLEEEEAICMIKHLPLPFPAKKMPWPKNNPFFSFANFLLYSSEYSLEGLRLNLRLQYFGHLMQRADSQGKNPDAGKD